LLILILISYGSQPQSALRSSEMRYAHSDTQHSEALLWTNDGPVAETSTLQQTTLTTDKHPCPGWDSYPQYRQLSGRKP